jgi:hypothetical protein
LLYDACMAAPNSPVLRMRKSVGYGSEAGQE